jgi:hypothetical protein
LSPPQPAESARLASESRSKGARKDAAKIDDERSMGRPIVSQARRPRQADACSGIACDGHRDEDGATAAIVNGGVENGAIAALALLGIAGLGVGVPMLVHNGLRWHWSRSGAAEFEAAHLRALPLAPPPPAPASPP